MALAPGDAKRGAELYVAQCEHCHTLEKGGPHTFGPNLYGILGQKSGQMQFEYLADTKTPFPGSKKPYKGLPDARDRNDVIA